MISLGFCSQQLRDWSEDSDAAANLPQSYKHTADWFLNISLCVSLQMQRGKIASLKSLAVQNFGMSRPWIAWRESTSLRSMWESQEVGPERAAVKAVITWTHQDHTAYYPLRKDDLILILTKHRQTSVSLLLWLFPSTKQKTKTLHTTSSSSCTSKNSNLFLSVRGFTRLQL